MARLLAAFCVVVVLSGCSTPPPPTPAPTSQTVQTAGSVVPTVDASRVLETGVPEPAAPATLGADDRRAAAMLATNAVAAWTNTSRGEAVWRAGLASWLSKQAQAFYADVDPRNIAQATVNGEATFLDDESSPSLATVTVPTTAGRYLVVLNRVDAGEPWSVTKVTLER